jgi:hypothetical protein
MGTHARPRITLLFVACCLLGTRPVLTNHDAHAMHAYTKCPSFWTPHLLSFPEEIAHNHTSHSEHRPVITVLSLYSSPIKIGGSFGGSHITEGTYRHETCYTTSP